MIMLELQRANTDYENKIKDKEKKGMELIASCSPSAGKLKSEELRKIRPIIDRLSASNLNMQKENIPRKLADLREMLVVVVKGLDGLLQPTCLL